MKKYGFSREERITKKEDFQKVIKEGKAIPVEGWTAYILKKESGRTRFGISVSKKSGKPVHRNRVKRIFREIFRLNKHSLPLSDIVVIYKGEAKGINFEETKNKFLEAMKNA
jgi:ribonuclease P protein component